MIGVDVAIVSEPVKVNVPGEVIVTLEAKLPTPGKVTLNVPVKLEFSYRLLEVGRERTPPPDEQKRVGLLFYDTRHRFDEYIKAHPSHEASDRKENGSIARPVHILTRFVAGPPI